MTNNKSDVVSGRILLKKTGDKNWRGHIMHIYDVAAQMVGIDTKKLELVCCISANKHTCLTTDSEGKNYLLLDEHHLEVLSALNLLYYIYGKRKIKSAIFDEILAQMNYFEKRLKSTILILLAEKYILEGQVSSAFLLCNCD